MATPAIRTKIAGPAALLPDNSPEDILDEALNFFRVNLLFKNYDIKGEKIWRPLNLGFVPTGPGDVLIIYMTVFITQCLKKVATE